MQVSSPTKEYTIPSVVLTEEFTASSIPPTEEYTTPEVNMTSKSTFSSTSTDHVTAKRPTIVTHPSNRTTMISRSTKRPMKSWKIYRINGLLNEKSRKIEEEIKYLIYQVMQNNRLLNSMQKQIKGWSHYHREISH